MNDLQLGDTVLFPLIRRRLDYYEDSVAGLVVSLDAEKATVEVDSVRYIVSLTQLTKQEQTEASKA